MASTRPSIRSQAACAALLIACALGGFPRSGIAATGLDKAAPFQDDWAGGGPQNGANNYRPGKMEGWKPAEKSWSSGLVGEKTAAVVCAGKVVVWGSGENGQDSFLAGLGLADGHELWSMTAAKGSAYGSPVLAGGRIFTMARETSGNALLCLDPGTGKEHWRRASKDLSEYSSLIAADSDIVLIEGASLLRLNGANGKAKFTQPLKKGIGRLLGIHDRTIYALWQSDYSDGKVMFVRFAAETGKPGAESDVPDGFALGGPLSVIAGDVCICGRSPHYAIGLNDGKTRWKTGGFSKAAPTIAHDSVYFMDGDVLSRVSLDGGQVEQSLPDVKLLWYQPAVCDDVAAASGPFETVIVERQSLKPLMTIPQGGRPIFAGGCLLLVMPVLKWSDLPNGAGQGKPKPQPGIHCYPLVRGKLEVPAVEKKVAPPADPFANDPARPFKNDWQLPRECRGRNALLPDSLGARTAKLLWSAPNDDYASHSPLIYKGVVITVCNYRGKAPALEGREVASGNLLWEAPLAAQILIHGNKLFAFRFDFPEDRVATVNCLDPLTGSQDWSVVVSMPSSNSFDRPGLCVEGDEAWLNRKGTLRINLKTRKLISPAESFGSRGSTLRYGKNILVLSEGKLAEFDPARNEVLWETRCDCSGGSRAYDEHGELALSGRMLLACAARLVCVDLERRRESWSLDNTGGSNIVVVGSSVFVGAKNDTNVVAREVDLKTGGVLRSFTADAPQGQGPPGCNEIIVTQDSLICADPNGRTLIFSRTGELRQTLPGAGSMALGNGVLVIAGSTQVKNGQMLVEKLRCFALVPARKNSAPVAENISGTAEAGVLTQLRLKAKDSDGDKLAFVIKSVQMPGFLRNMKEDGSAEPLGRLPATLSTDTVGVLARAPRGGGAPATLNVVYYATDGDADSNEATLTINFSSKDAVEMPGVREELALAGTELPGYVYPGAVPQGASFETTAQPAQGTLTLGQDGSYRYLPRNDAAGNDSFKVVVITQGKRGQAIEIKLHITALKEPRPRFSSNAPLTAVIGQELRYSPTFDRRGTSHSASAMILQVVGKAPQGLRIENEGNAPRVTWTGAGSPGETVTFTLRANEHNGAACDFQTVTLKLVAKE